MTDVTDVTSNTAAGVRAALQRYLDALVDGDIDTIRASFAHDATWWIHGDLPISGTMHGADAIVDFLISASALFVPETWNIEFGDITVEGDRAVLEWRVRATGSATGLAYDNSYCGVFVIRDSRITAVREFLDSLHAHEVLFGA